MEVPRCACEAMRCLPPPLSHDQPSAIITPHQQCPLLLCVGTPASDFYHQCCEDRSGNSLCNRTFDLAAPIFPALGQNGSRQRRLVPVSEHIFINTGEITSTGAFQDRANEDRSCLFSIHTSHSRAVARWRNIHSAEARSKRTLGHQLRSSHTATLHCISLLRVRCISSLFLTLRL